jgi:hypothetical protein
MDTWLHALEQNIMIAGEGMGEAPSPHDGQEAVRDRKGPGSSNSKYPPPKRSTSSN